MFSILEPLAILSLYALCSSQTPNTELIRLALSSNVWQPVLIGYAGLPFTSAVLLSGNKTVGVTNKVIKNSYIGSGEQWWRLLSICIFTYRIKYGLLSLYLFFILKIPFPLQIYGFSWVVLVGIVMVSKVWLCGDQLLSNSSRSHLQNQFLLIFFVYCRSSQLARKSPQIFSFYLDFCKELQLYLWF